MHLDLLGFGRGARLLPAVPVGPDDLVLLRVHANHRISGVEMCAGLVVEVENCPSRSGWSRPRLSWLNRRLKPFSCRNGATMSTPILGLTAVNSPARFRSIVSSSTNGDRGLRARSPSRLRQGQQPRERCRRVGGGQRLAATDRTTEAFQAYFAGSSWSNLSGSVTIRPFSTD